MISDSYVEFWYRFVDPSRSLIARGLGERVWSETIVPALHHYVSRPAFERACRQYLWRAMDAGKLPIGLYFSDVGTWWGAKDREIDIVAINESNKVLMVGECKWTNAQVDITDYASVLNDLELAEPYFQYQVGVNGTTIEPWIFLFSKSGFTPDLIQLAASQTTKRLFLVTLEEMYAV